MLIGNTNKDPGCQEYFQDCKDLARSSNGAIEIHSNISEDDLFALYQKGFGYVHGTGAFQKPGENPFKCEHLGLSIIEAMAHGCIPLVYGRGGIFDFIRPFENGFPYMTKEQMVGGMQRTVKLWDSDARDEFTKEVIKAAENQNIDTFTRRLADYISSAMYGEQ